MKRLHIAVLTLSGMAILVLGGALAQEADVQAIEAVPERYMAAQAGQDAEALAALYTDDAIFFNAFGEVLEGREALMAYWQAGFEGPPIDLAIDSRETVVHNDTGYNIGRYTVTDEEGQVMAQGHYLVVMSRADGEWRIHRHFTNMILPEMPMPEGDDGM